MLDIHLLIDALDETLGKLETERSRSNNPFGKAVVSDNIVCLKACLGSFNAMLQELVRTASAFHEAEKTNEKTYARFPELFALNNKALDLHEYNINFIQQSFLSLLRGSDPKAILIRTLRFCARTGIGLIPKGGDVLSIIMDAAQTFDPLPGDIDEALGPWIKRSKEYTSWGIFLEVLNDVTTNPPAAVSELFTSERIARATACYKSRCEQQ